VADVLRLLFFVEFFDQDVGAYKPDAPNQHVPPNSVYDVPEVFSSYVADSREPRRGWVGNYVNKPFQVVGVGEDLSVGSAYDDTWREDVFKGPRSV